MNRSEFLQCLRDQRLVWALYEIPEDVTWWRVVIGKPVSTPGNRVIGSGILYGAGPGVGPVDVDVDAPTCNVTHVGDGTIHVVTGNLIPGPNPFHEVDSLTSVLRIVQEYYFSPSSPMRVLEGFMPASEQ